MEYSSHIEHHHHIKHIHHHSTGSKLMWVTLLNVGITVVQVIGGLLSNSLALLSDAFHNLGDSSALFIAFIAGKLSRKKPNIRNTFGYKRIEILAALFNSVVLIAICLFLFYEAYKRFISPEPVKGALMLIIAVFGLLANLASMLLLQKDKKENLNIKAAYLHLLGDTLSSFAVIAGGIVMWKYGIYWIDPLITVLVGFVIIYQTWDVIKETVDILMQSAPADVDIREIRTELEKMDEIDNIHHIHIWKLNDSQTYFEAHVNLKRNITVEEMMKVQLSMEQLLKEHFRIAHTTLQFGYDCCNGKTQLIAQK